MSRPIPFRVPPHATPARLSALPSPPPELWTTGDLRAARAVAIVGTRECAPEAAEFTRELAIAIAGAGAVVVSGGALGIDGEAHRGALEAGGRTWAVLGHGHESCYPSEHRSLFDAIAETAGALVWPFPPAAPPWPKSNFLKRNGVLVALADAVVMVQAPLGSGARNAAHWGRRLGKPVYTVATPPWTKGATRTGYEGNALELDAGARPITSLESLLRALGLAPPGRRARSSAAVAREPPPRRKADEPREARAADPVWAALSEAPRHVDEIAARVGVAPHELAPALLTLALENVVVEGPSGFYRRRVRS